MTAFLSQVNSHALLAYLGPRELAGDADGGEASDLTPGAKLRGRRSEMADKR